MKITIYVICLVLILSCNKNPQFNLENATSVSESIIDFEALTCTNGIYGNIINGQSFQQNALITYKDWQYVVYYNKNRNVCVGRREITSLKWEILTLTDHRFAKIPNDENDTHNTISIGLCTKDGTIHLAFDMHATALNYRVSKQGILENPSSVPWNASIFSPVQDYLEKGKALTEVTYPSFITKPDGNLILGYRNGYSSNLDYKLVLYDGTIGEWKNEHTIIAGTGPFMDPYDGLITERCAYINGLNYDNSGRLHVTWTWRESFYPANRDICYAYSMDDGDTWYNYQNQIVGNRNNPLLTISTLSDGITIKNLDRGWGLMNQQSQNTDSKGNIHTVMYHFTSKINKPRFATYEASHYFHYYKSQDGTIVENELPYIGNRPKILIDQLDNLYLLYINKDGFAYQNESANLEIVKLSSSSNWKNSEIVYSSSEPYFNEVQVDPVLWEKKGIISIMLQKAPNFSGESTILKIMDIKLVK